MIHVHRAFTGLALAALLSLWSTEVAWAQGRGPREDKRPDGGPKVGEPAPDFTLSTLDGSKEVTLSSFQGKQPVFLIFGSYTWPPFRKQAGRLEEIYQEYKEDAAFFVIYIREAHPTDGKVSRENVQQGIEIAQPKSKDARESVAKTCVDKLDLSMPFLIDDMKNTVANAWFGGPDRIYVVGADGKIAYRGAKGPKGFKPDEAVEVLEKLLGRGKK